MKNLLLTSFILLLCFGCNHSRNGHSKGNLSDSAFVYKDQLIKIDSIKRSDFEKYPKVDYKKTLVNSEIIKKSNDTLKFVIDSLQSVVFVDTLTTEENDGIIKYEHVGQILDYYLVQAQYYESSGFYVVNKKNGLKYNMISLPDLSPNHKYFLCISAYLEYQVMPTGLQVWMIKKDKLEKKVDLDLGSKGFEIDEIRWITDDKIAVKMGFETGKSAYGIMTIK